MITLIIGRKEPTKELNVVAKSPLVKGGSTTFTFGQPGSVPQTVSREHCQIDVDEKTGEMRVTNLKNDVNPLYVNGLQVNVKDLRPTDLLELGPNRYVVPLHDVLSKLPTPVSVGHLKAIYNNYHDTQLKYKINRERLNAASTITGIFTMSAMAVSFIPNVPKVVRLVLYGVALLLAISFCILRLAASKGPKYLDDLTMQYQKDYVCPECGCYLGSKTYDMLMQHGKCPNCRKLFKE